MGLVFRSDGLVHELCNFVRGIQDGEVEEGDRKMNDNLAEYQKVQAVAKIVLEEIEKIITENSTEKEIAERCKKLLEKHGIQETWYYGCPALVLLGSQSCVSVSGKDYFPSEEKVGTENLITIDLSPLKNGIWGDCSRTFVFENGKIQAKENVKNDEFAKGLKIEEFLHNHFKNYVKVGMTFEQIYFEMNCKIQKFDYENLDFLGNVGHTIETKKENRLYFEKDNKTKLNENMLFTFEPHIRKVGKKWGFKLENIYYFSAVGVEEL